MGDGDWGGTETSERDENGDSAADTTLLLKLPCSQEETRREKQEGKTCDHHHACGKMSRQQTCMIEK